MMRVHWECLCSCWLELPQPEFLAPALLCGAAPFLCSFLSCVWEWDGQQSAGGEQLSCASIVFLGFNSFFPIIITIIFYFISVIKLFESPPTNFTFFQFSSIPVGGEVGVSCVMLGFRVKS